jgi:serine-type D-Ala-D-Ala carboxypeptidase (penicillin-binding protein 5/6)
MKNFLWLIVWAAAGLAPAAWGQSIARDPYIGAIVLDAANGQVLFEDGADRPGYPASMLKLMDLFVVLDRVKDGTHRLDEMVGVTPEAAAMGGTQVWLDTRESFPLDDMLYALIVASANDVAEALAGHVGGSREGFVRLMNEKARALGLSPVTQFQSPHGLPPPKGQRPDITTARDFAKLCKALLDTHPEALRYTSTTDREFRPEPKLFMLHTRNRLLRTLSGCDGLKTGYIQMAGFSIAATAQRDGRRVIAVILGSADRQKRDAKAAELVNRYLPQASLPAAPTPAPVVQRPAAAPAPVPIVEVEEGADDEDTEAPAPARRGWGRTAGVVALVAFLAAIVAMAVQRRLLLTR